MPLSGEKEKTIQFEELAVKDYEKVYKITDDSVGLKAIIAIHNTRLGMTLGGVRIFPYANFDLALTDVLRLSEGMTYKSAIAGVGFGGGKSVIIADPKKDKDERKMLRFGEAVHMLQGQYIAAEDVGSTPEDMAIIRKATPYVVGLMHKNSSGDPGPFTAYGIFRGIQSVLQKIYGSNSLAGKKIALQGLGNVGMPLLNYLFWAGADLTVADIYPHNLEYVTKKFRPRIVEPSEIHKVPCDVFVPCAMGGIINDQTIPQMQCKSIAGCANNQLLAEHHAEILKDKKILYAPDFVINAGGLINVAMEVTSEGYNPIESRKKIDKIYDQLLAIYDIAEKNKTSTHVAAVTLAKYRMAYEIGKRSEPPHFHH
ncbi:MAG: Glu/Leu/Phe/Val dehydrogenase [Parachlamydiales bacterium]|nr:Glu/Leu/Phe/Val dehydrogenase [Parachlamydiales bacterium]